MKRATRGAGTFLATAIVLCLLVAVAPAGAAAFGQLSAFGPQGEGAGQSAQPEQIAIGADGSIYVADVENQRIDVFDAAGSFLRAFGLRVNASDDSNVCTTASGCRRGTFAEDAGALGFPEGVAISPGGLVLVGEEANGRVSVFTQAGVFLYAFGKGVNVETKGDVCTVTSGCKAGSRGGLVGAIGDPVGLAFGPEGLLYVTDLLNNRIAVMTADGEFVRALGKGVNPETGGNVCTVICRTGTLDDGSAGAMNRPIEVAVSADGLLAVADADNNRVDVFSRDGAFVRAIGSAVAPGGADVCTAVTGCVAGKTAGSPLAMKRPRAVALGRDGVLVVADSGGSRVLQVELTGGLVGSFAAPEPAGFAVDCSGSLFVSEAPANASLVARFGEVGAPNPPCAPASPPPPQPGSNRFKVGKVKLNRKAGTATLVLSASTPGRFLLRGKGVRPAKANLAKAGSVRLLVKPSGAVKRKLAANGKAKVRLKIAFTPKGGLAALRSKSLVLKKTIRRR